MSIELRPEVRAFAEAMERKLRQNDGKGSWENETESYLYSRIDEEMTELKEARRKYIFDRTNVEKRLTVINECADVANFLMMLADTCGVLETEE